MSATSELAQARDRPAQRAASAGFPRIRGTTAVIVLATGLGLALRFYELARPGYLLGLTGYDDGVDFGSAIRLATGALPYRDFAFVQPPGIAVLLAPLGFLAKSIGTDHAFAAARVLTTCAGGASVLLVGVLVRHRGVLATALSCGLAAVYPEAILSSHSVLLEPWLVLFCLLGAVSVFQHGEVTASKTRLALGGVALGLAGTIKVWAVLPALVLLVVCWGTAGYRRALTLLAGMAGGFVVVVAPFAALAPRAFYNSVVVAQLSRVDVHRMSASSRMTSMDGISELHPSAAAAIAIFIVIVALVVVFTTWRWIVSRRRLQGLEWFAAAAFLVIVGAFLWPPDYYQHYGGFLGPFLALAVALAISGLIAHGQPARPRATSAVGLAAVALALGGMAAVDFRHEASLATRDPAQGAPAKIPDGACVLTDNPSLTIIANRFISTDPRCPAMLDAIGTDYTLARGRNALDGAANNRAVLQVWSSALAHARFVWLYCGPPGKRRCDASTNRRIPWTPAIRTQFVTQFRYLPGRPAHLFARRS